MGMSGGLYGHVHTHGPEWGPVGLCRVGITVGMGRHMVNSWIMGVGACGDCGLATADWQLRTGDCGLATGARARPRPHDPHPRGCAMPRACRVWTVSHDNVTMLNGRVRCNVKDC